MRKQNMSSPSPVTDGRTVWVMTGTGMLKAFDFDGKELWMRDIQKDYGRFGLQWGYASSPLLHEDSLYVQVLHGMNTDDPSYVLRIDKADRQDGVARGAADQRALANRRMRTRRPRCCATGGTTEIVITGGDVVTGHDPATGKELWRADGLNPTNDGSYRIVASPVVVRRRRSSRRRASGRCWRCGPAAAATSPRRTCSWSFNNGPDVPTPVTDGTYLYSINDRGIMYCLDAQDRQAPSTVRSACAPATYSGSPVLADGKIYITDEDGVTSVVQAGPKFELLAENDLDEYTLSSPAVSEGQIFIRTDAFLYAIGQRRKQ